MTRPPHALPVLTLFIATSGCMRWGYDPEVRRDASDAAPADALSDAGSADRDAGRFTRQDAAAQADAAVALDAGAGNDQPSDAGAPDAAADGVADLDAGPVIPTCPAEVNACGGCAGLSALPDSPCGTCGLGAIRCTGADTVECIGGSTTPTTATGTLLLDDFEDGDRQFRSGPIHGEWYLVSDSTTGVLSPATNAELVPTPPGANDSAGALHVSGSGFSKWGAGFQGSLNQESCYVDAAAQTGVSFFARGTGVVQLMLATRQTVPTEDGGSCVGTCYDNFATTFTLTDAWKPYEIPWSTLQQGGWGTAATFQSNALKFVQFSFAAGSSMDLYLDDVAFY